MVLVLRRYEAEIHEANRTENACRLMEPRLINLSSQQWNRHVKGCGETMHRTGDPKKLVNGSGVIREYVQVNVRGPQSVELL